MIDLSKPNEHQRVDPTNNLVEPWLVFPALDEIKMWDLQTKRVFEYGCGAGTLWWADKCELVVSIETNADWFDAVHSRRAEKMVMRYYVEKNEFVRSIIEAIIQFDIIIIDCDPIEWRNDCIQPALKCLKPNGKLIIDNWNQPSCDWMVSKENREQLLSMPHKIFKQPNHKDWTTLIVTK